MAVIAVCFALWYAVFMDGRSAGVATSQQPTSTVTTSTYECDGDARICPDGSIVGRTGPSCEFEACPPLDATSAVIRTTLGQKMTGLGVGLTPLEIVEDSRCPADVQCIWAGTVKVKVKIESGLGSSEMVLEIGKTVTTEAESITLTSVTPPKNSGDTIPASSYRFTFDVSKR